MKPVYIIAEAGVNHNGSPDLAFKLIDAAIDAGADAVKFQTFKADKLVTKTAQKAQYQQETTGDNESQYQMLKRLELSEALHYKLIAYCKERDIEFLSTAFDEDSLVFLQKKLGLTTLKIPSGDLTNAPLLLAHARTGCDLIVSTGMATLDEIEDALGVVAYGYLNPTADITDTGVFKKAYASDRGKILLKEKVTILHCTTEYPAPLEDINLKAMDTMARHFNLPIGYSDHSKGIIVPIAAVARGAVLIEKHFTLDNSMEGPDHRASLEPDELKAMTEAIRIVEKTLGDGNKVLMPSEVANKEIARKSLVAAKDIQAGELYSENNLCIKRPGNGMVPINYWKLLGKSASISIKAGGLINE